MRVVVIGTGYVGLVAGACLAELGHRVTCIDRDRSKVAMLERGELPIYEPGLDEMVPRLHAEGRLDFRTELAGPVAEADVVLVAVGTPADEDGSADLAHVMGVAEELGGVVDGRPLVVLKSTVPIGTCRRFREVLERRAGGEVEVASNPEFLREGVAVRDFLDPDRIVLGCASERSRRTLESLYDPLVQGRHGGNVPVLVMDLASAELTKYASNAMLASRISFVNEVANLCEEVGADVDKVRRGIGADHRIGGSFLRPGVGYGGSCFPKDVRALLQSARQHDVPLRILEASDAVNREQRRRLAETIRADLGEGGSLAGRRVALWGLAFKPETDDVREAPALDIARGLLEAGAEVVAYDPAATEGARAVLGEAVSYAPDREACVEGADALVLVTEWAEFAHPGWDRLRGLLRQPRIYDGRNLWDPEEVRRAGFTYRGIGRS